MSGELKYDALNMDGPREAEARRRGLHGIADRAILHEIEDDGDARLQRVRCEDPFKRAAADQGELKLNRHPALRDDQHQVGIVKPRR